MTESLNKQDPFQAALKLAREEAAGGVCSMLVLDLMHMIDQCEVKSSLSRLDDSWTKPRRVSVCENQEISQEKITLQPLTTTLQYGARLARSQSHLPYYSTKSVEQTIYYIEPIGDETYAIPLWNMIERSEDSQDCSIAIFLPARDQGDLDYSLVATSNDESNPYSLQQLVSEQPITHKSVLEDLKRVLKSSSVFTSYNLLRDTEEQIISTSKTLFEKLQIAELRKRLLPLGNGELATRRNETDPVTSYIFDLRSIAGSVHEGISAKTTEAGNEFNFVLNTATGRIACSGAFNLGTSKRTALLGQLLPPDSPLESYTAYLDAAPDEPSEKLFDLLGKALKVPEIVTDDELIGIINDILKNALEQKPYSLRLVDEKIQKLVNRYRKTNEIADTTHIDIGSLDISQLEGGKFLHEARYIRAQVKANKKQDVFSKARNLYGCEVQGAAKAFNFHTTDNGETARRCLAIDCKEAFIAGKIKQSVALNCTKSFLSTDADYCIARGSKIAFQYTNARDCQAIDCEEVFTPPQNRSHTGATAIQRCTTQHTPEFTGKVAKNKRKPFFRQRKNRSF